MEFLDEQIKFLYDINKQIKMYVEKIKIDCE